MCYDVSSIKINIFDTDTEVSLNKTKHYMGNNSVLHHCWYDVTAVICQVFIHISCHNSMAEKLPLAAHCLKIYRYAALPPGVEFYIQLWLCH